MDKLKHYRQIAREALLPFTAIKYANGDFRNRVVFDDEHNRYLVGSDSARYHGCVVDWEIINGKIWIQDDNADYGVALDLERLGVPKSDIVLGFHPPEVRPHTEYAAA